MLPVLRIHQISESGYNCNGDSTLLQYSDHFRQANVLIDSGIRKRVVTRYLQKIGVEKIDLIIASHIDLDHIGGLRDVLSNIDVGELWVMNINSLRNFIQKTSGFEREKLHFLKCFTETHKSLTIAKGKKVHCFSVYQGYNTKIGPLFLEVLWPPFAFEKFLRDPANVVKILETGKGRTYKKFLEEGHLQEGIDTEIRVENNRREVTPDQSDWVNAYSERVPQYDKERLQENFGLASRGLLNNVSIVVRVSCLSPSCPTPVFEPLTMLFPGDLEDWTYLFKKYFNYIDTKLLKIPHHGSDRVEFNGQSLYKFLRPRISLVFPYPRYGLPSRKVIATLARNGLVSCVSCKQISGRQVSDGCCSKMNKCTALDSAVYDITPHGFCISNGHSICTGILRP